MTQHHYHTVPIKGSKRNSIFVIVMWSALFGFVSIIFTIMDNIVIIKMRAKLQGLFRRLFRQVVYDSSSMPYVSVREESEERLHLCREPSARAWAILIGLLSLGLGAAYYSVDYLLWKLAYISGALFVGLSCMEDWEECIFDKKTGQVSIKKLNFIQKYLQSSQGQKSVVANIDEVKSVQVAEEQVKYGGTGYMVILHFYAGYQLGLTETATIGDRSEHEMIAKKIEDFLQLDAKLVTSTVPEPMPVPEENDNSSTTSDESFEQIDKAELIDESKGEPDDKDRAESA